MSAYNEARKSLGQKSFTWLITGVAGFIGSNLLEELLVLGQNVVGLDDFSTGKKANLQEVESSVPKNLWGNFRFIEGDIRDLSICRNAINGVDFVLHQAALGSVPRSIENPITSNDVNISGFLNLLCAAKDANVSSFTYAASSSTYGDHPALPKVESVIGSPLSPYAVTKYVNELYANVFKNTYGFKATGLRYFNVFGRRQDPDGAYAAVIPRWTASLIKGDDIYINGDGETSRDFCFIENVVQANILAALADDPVRGEVYNVAVGGRTSLNQLFELLVKSLANLGVEYTKEPIYRDFRAGDVKHSQADISKIRSQLGYDNLQLIEAGISKAMPWYLRHLS